jgi:hypothetical protein
MMTSLYGGGACDLESAGYVTSSTTGTTVTSHATPGTDGAWTQIIAATANDWYAFTLIQHYGDSGAAGRGLIDLAIGGAGVEFAIVTGLPVCKLAAITRTSSFRLWLPLHIPKGARISARVHRSDVASLPVRIQLIGETVSTRGLPPFRRATTYGEDLANARGTVVDPGASANTLGANTQIVASTTNPIRALYLAAMKQDASVVSGSATWAAELYVGAGGSEVVIVPEVLLWEENSTTDLSHAFGLGMGPFPVNVPAASRLSAKARCNISTAGAREGQLIVLGLD